MLEATLGAQDTWQSKDLRLVRCAGLTNSPLQSVTGVWNLSIKNNFLFSHDLNMQTLSIDNSKLSMTSNSNSGALPIRWMAPEALLDGIYTTASDVW